MKQILKTLLIIIIIDILIIGVWTWYIDPNDSSSIALIILIPIVFLANLIIAGVMYFIKRYYTQFFLLNAFISSFIFFFFFYCYIKTGSIVSKINREDYQFIMDNKSYNISYHTKDTNYYMFVSSCSGEGFLNLYDQGIVKKQNDTIYFFSVDSNQYYIYKDCIYNFKDFEKIKVKKVN